MFLIKISNSIKELFKTDRATPPIGKITLFGISILLFFFIIFGLWATLFPLETASIAPGKIVVASSRKSIQHLEGGIIRKIFVKEGTVVKKNDPLIQLDNVREKATYSLYHQQVNELNAISARLIAQRDGQNYIHFPENLLRQENDPEVLALMNSQRALFESENKSYKGQLEILQQRIAQQKMQIESYKAQVISNDKQLKLIGLEIDAVQALVVKHIIEKPRLWALMRESAKLTGNRDELQSSIAQVEQKIGETQQQIYALQDARKKDILQQLADNQSKLTNAQVREIDAKEILNRTLITAPQNGTVVFLQEHTIGGVILAGKTILDIMPSEDKLIVEAHVKPVDIDSVYPGLIAKIRLLPFKQRNTPWIEGMVEVVSNDIFESPQKTDTYYIARIIINGKKLNQMTKEIKLYPGMPVEVMIVTQKKTPLQYFLTPIRESFSRAFREQ